MGLYDLFSKRQKKLRGDVPDVYVYDEFPTELRDTRPRSKPARTLHPFDRQHCQFAELHNPSVLAAR